MNNDIYFSKQKKIRLIKNKLKTTNHYGKTPKSRNVDELLECGLIILDKPKGPTSHQVDAWIREITESNRVGHGGTLDPNATGVLPIAIGNSTRALSVLLSADKEYIGIMRLHKKIGKKEIHKVFKKFIGEIVQIPPVRSAVRRVSRKRNIYYLDILEINNKNVLFRVGCESGTYIRTLCVSLGKELKSGAHLSELRRTRVGLLSEKSAVLLQDIKDAFIFWRKDHKEKWIKNVILPIEEMFNHLPKIIIRDSAVDSLCHGANLAIPGVVEIDSNIKKNDVAVVLTLKGEGVAIVNMLMNSEEVIKNKKGFCAILDRVLMKKNTYPSIWRKS
jgi:H/ACA ribonucleoprotein complex subunit 4